MLQLTIDDLKKMSVTELKAMVFDVSENVRAQEQAITTLRQIIFDKSNQTQSEPSSAGNLVVGELKAKEEEAKPIKAVAQPEVKTEPTLASKALKDLI